MKPGRIGRLGAGVLLALVSLLVPLATTLAAEAASPHAVVFMYHRFGEDRYPSTSVRIEQFEAHLGYLEEAGYLTSERVGRRNRYQLAGDLPLRHPLEQDRTVTDLLSALHSPDS